MSDKWLYFDYNGRFIQLAIGKEVAWFRVFNRGLAIKRTPLLFSERYGNRKYLKLPLGWRLVYLRKPATMTCNY